jgi:hypothetical protein
LTERFDNDNGKLTFNGNPGNLAKNEQERAANAGRYIIATVERLNTLCPRSSYTLTFHQYNNVACKCKNVGPLLNGAISIISDSLATSSRGDITSASGGSFVINEKVNLSLVRTQFSPVSALGGSCVLTLNDNCYRPKPCKKGKGKKKARKCAPACPIKLCAPIQLIEYS